MIFSCHQCGRSVRRPNQPRVPTPSARLVTALHREVRTGERSDGSAFYRRVNICRSCAEAIDARHRFRQAILFAAAAGLGTILGTFVVLAR